MSTSSASPPKSRGELSWRPTKIMNMQDLSKDDDFLSHLLVEKLGTGTVPLYVHKMDPSRKLPKTDAADLLDIVRRLVTSKLQNHHAIRDAVNALLCLPGVQYYLRDYEQPQINAFATHASRYFELYQPTGSIEISHTSRYAHRTGKSELCILATRFLPPGSVITELKGSMADLTDTEERDLRRRGVSNGEIRRDFSVIHSKQLKKNHLFLGPARFVNHDCENNCELFREGRYITFRVIKPIAVGQEITAHYGDGYFGKRNRHCLCETCERNGRGGYAPENAEDAELSSDSSSGSDSDSDSDTSSSDAESENEKEQAPLNLDERRTRRGVYAVMKSRSEDRDGESSDGLKEILPVRSSGDVSRDPSQLTSVVSGRNPHPRSSSSVSLLSTPPSTSTAPYSTIATRRQKSRVSPTTAQDPAASPDTPTRVTRSASSSTNVLSKRKRIDTPSSVTVQQSLATAKNKKGDIQIKKEEVEPRLLRTRPSQLGLPTEQSKEHAEPPTPKGPDGKPLPTCITCHNVLPVISVNSQVVWGMGFDTPRKRKKQRCPRCVRHLAIYGQEWPRRLPVHGATPTFIPEPSRTPTKVISPKTLPVVDRKLAAEASKSRRDDRDNDRPRKRQKMDAATDDKKRGRPISPSVPHAIKVEEDSSTALLQEKTPISVASSNRTPTHKKPQTPLSRNLSRAERAAERERHRKELEQSNSGGSAPSKRSRDNLNDVEEGTPTKRGKYRAEDLLQPLQKVVPRPSYFHSGRLFSNPNPLSFAVSAWRPPFRTPPLIADEDSSSDDMGPVTPEDVGTPASSAEEDSASSSLPTRPIATLKPTPFTFARKRWSHKQSPVEVKVSLPPEPEPIVSFGVFGGGSRKRRFSQFSLADSPDSDASDDVDIPRLVSEERLTKGLMHTYPPLNDNLDSLSFTKSSPQTEQNDLPVNFVDAAWEILSDASDS